MRFVVLCAVLASLVVANAAPEKWIAIEISELPNPTEIDYPNCVTYLALRNSESDREIRAAGYGIFDRKLTNLGKLRVGEEIVVEALETIPAGTEKEMRVDDLTRLDLPLRWIDAVAIEQPSEDEIALQNRLRMEVVSIQRTLLAQIGPVTGGVNDDFFFYGDRQFLRKDFWKDSEVEGGGVYVVLRQFHEILEERGIRFIVAPVPCTATIFPEKATNLYYKPDLHGSVNTAMQALMDALEKGHGIETIDLTSDFLKERYFEHEGESYPIYRPNDTHWSAQAAQMVAEKCASLVGTETNNPLFEQHTEVVTLKSDIESILASKHPHRDQVVALHRSPVFRVKGVNSEAASWIDHSQKFPNARVHLIGDSFVDALAEWESDVHRHLVSQLGEPVARIERYGGCSRILQDWLDSYGKSGSAEVVIFLFGERFAAIDSEWQPLKIND